MKMKTKQLYYERKDFHYDLPYEGRKYHSHGMFEARLLRIAHPALNDLYILHLWIPDIDDPEEWQENIIHIHKRDDSEAIRETIIYVDKMIQVIELKIERLANDTSQFE